MALKKILIDATGIVDTPTGLGKYSYYLLKTLLKSSDYRFVVLHQTSLTKTHPLFQLSKTNLTFMSVDAPTIGPKRELTMFGLRKEINEYDIFHCLSSYLPAFGLRIPSIVTIHDLKYLLFPDFFGNRFKTLYYDWVIRKGIRNASRVIAVSEATKRDIKDLGVRSDKIQVIYEASTIPFSGSSDDLPDELRGKSYLLFVGENRPHKNIFRLIKAYNNVLCRLGELCPFLVFVGSGFNSLKERCKCEKILICGLVSEAKVVSLYRHAIVLVYPSLYEGFGLPILEAMSTETPVITSNCSSMPEVAGEAAIFVDPYNVDQLADAILKIIQDNSEKRRLGHLGAQRAKCFSWKRAAKSIEALYTRILSYRENR